MHDLDKEFDLKLRSLLDGVEEEVPQRVWEGVSSRIGRRRAPVAWMRWAGAGIAAAAAVALALVVGNNFQSKVQAPVIPSADLFAESEAQPLVMPEEKLTEQESVPEGIQTATTRRTVSHEVQSHAAAEQQAVVVENIEEAVTADHQEQAPAPEKKQENARKGTKKTESWSDPFALMAYEDAHRKEGRKTSVGFNGLVGTNDGAKPGSHGHGMMGAAGSKLPKGLSENSESSYGVPVSVGLGARFHLTDALALNTGVTWSSLNRTFKGHIYKNDMEYDCDATVHNVQYIGIPVTLSYDVISNNVFDFYTFAGGSVEKCISSKYSMPGITMKGDASGFQYSAALGLGVQFNLGEHLGLYIDPSARYWMGKDQPKSIRTQQPFMFNIELGLRFEL